MKTRHPFYQPQRRRRVDLRLLAAFISLILCLGVFSAALESSAGTSDPVGTWKVTFVRANGTKLQGYAIFDGKAASGKWLLTFKNGQEWLSDFGNYKTSGTKLTLQRGNQGLQGTGIFQSKSALNGNLIWGAEKYTFTATDPQVAGN